jgi:transmembrane sensor
MNGAYAHDDDRRSAAAEWVVRLQAADLSEADALAFDAWLSAEPANALAYDAALSVDRAYAANAQAVREGLSRPRRPVAPRRWAWPAAGAMAAAIAAAAVVLPSIEPAPKAALYATAVGEHRHVVLADGSTIDLNGGTRLSVVLRRHERDVALDEGQAVFAVAHDARRPFQVAAGDRIIRDVGTEFDVRRRARLLTVTVASGAVEVSPLGAASGEAFRLHPGQQLIHEEGSAVARLQTAEPDQALGWRTGKLVYRSQPLAQVVADLNAQFKTPIRIADPALAATPISGVLILDNEDAVVRRLALLVSAKPVVSDGSVTLQRFGAAGR